MIERKVIWTQKELEEACELTSYWKDFAPLARVTVAPSTKEIVKETSYINGVAKCIVIYLPPGVRDLVWVWLSLNGRFLVRAIGGDNQYHALLITDDIHPGDIVEVTIQNADSQWSHSVGVRVEVEEK